VQSADNLAAMENRNQRTLAVAKSVAAASATISGAEEPAMQIALPDAPVLTMVQSTDDLSSSLVQFSVTQGHWYEVQATTDLQSWDSIWQSAVAEADGIIQFADQDAKSYPARFYRVVSH
jgi:hypothetical protein